VELKALPAHEMNLALSWEVFPSLVETVARKPSETLFLEVGMRSCYPRCFALSCDKVKAQSHQSLRVSDIVASWDRLAYDNAIRHRGIEASIVIADCRRVIRRVEAR
jgi:hypothetical protein